MVQMQFILEHGNFNARAFASNFDLEQLQQAIQYAKIRGVKTNLTLNTLLKDGELEEAFLLAQKAYAYGIDAIIVQDFGLAKKLIQTFPDLPIHASTQMSIHNLQGVLELEDLGFKRVVLARELSENEIEYICQNSQVEIECFIHGALCVSYSGQCLFSSMVGGRSGNRGKCAQPCRLPYSLLENEKQIDQGYLLSTRDIMGLEHLPFLIQAGVTCFKIEGRMKNPEYVATVTRIYRKYIDLAQSNQPYEIEEKDKKELLQVFNRGLSSSGHLENKPNQELIYSKKPNNMGLPLGIVQKYQEKKGYLTVKLKEEIAIGDMISLEKETGSYHVSELMLNGKNEKKALPMQTVVIGRMKGNIHLGDKIYKMSSKELSVLTSASIQNENRKVALSAKVILKKNHPISIEIKSANSFPLYQSLSLTYENKDCIPVEATNQPLTKEKVLEQLNKTNPSAYYFKKIDCVLDSNLFLPKISSLNDLRRKSFELVENFARNSCQRTPGASPKFLSHSDSSITTKPNPKFSLFLCQLSFEKDYEKLASVDRIYLPLKFFITKKYEPILSTLSKKFPIYIYLPTIIKANYRNLLSTYLEEATLKYPIQGFVISNISNLRILENAFHENPKKKFEIIGNYTFNIYNTDTLYELQKYGLDQITLSPELNKSCIHTLSHNPYLPVEMIVYGKIPLMNMNYCLLGKTNRCYPTCQAHCSSSNHYYLKDRMGMKFPVLPDNIQTVTTIYNCKTLSLSFSDFNLDYVRMDILEESIEEINEIIQTVKSGKRFEGKDFTNGNLNREI